MITEAKIHSNLRRLQYLNGMWMFMLFMPIIVPYFKSFDLSLEQIYQLQAIYGIGIVLLEVPSGYVSDLLGRKRCLVVACLMYGLAGIALAFAGGFWSFVLYEILGAMAASLFSGTDVALLYDSLEARREHGAQSQSIAKSSSSWLGKRLFSSQMGECIAAPLGGMMAYYSLSLPIYGHAVVCWVPLTIALGLHEVDRSKMDRGAHLDNFKVISSVLFKQSKFVTLIFWNLVSYGLSTLLAVWLFQAYWPLVDVPLALFGWLWAGYNLAVALVAKVAHRVEEVFGPKRLILAVGVLPVLGYGSMALCLHYYSIQPILFACLGVLSGLCFQFGRGLTQVVIKDALNTRVESRMRATVNSMASLGVRLAFAICGPALGFAADTWGMETALLFASIFFVLVLLFLNLPLRRSLT